MEVTDAPLAPLVPALEDSSVVHAALTAAHPVVAIPDVARALTIAAMADRSRRFPILVAVPTRDEADHLAGDLASLLGPDRVELFPAWETLPFERVSPATETMGRRMRVMHRLRVGGNAAPRVVVAPARALVQRLSPHVEDLEPIELANRATLDRDAFIAELAAFGYRREYQVEARGEFAVRGSIIDVYPSDAEHPVRIDLWGDEIDRLTTFAITDQRSVQNIDRLTIYPARELLATKEVRERADRLIGSEPWGQAQWQRLADGETFDGMESWLPWLCDDQPRNPSGVGEHLLADLVGDDGLVLLVDPRRMRDRVEDLLAEEIDLAGALAGTWDVSAEGLPRLSLPFDRLLAHVTARVVTVVSTPEGPDTAQLVASRFDPVAGDTHAIVARINALRENGARVVIAADGRGSAARIADILATEGLVVPVVAQLEAPMLARPGVHIVVAPLRVGAVLPTEQIAVIAEADLTGRRRTHRKARGAKRSVDFYDDLRPGDYVVHHHHGVGRYEGMVSRSMGGVERDYLLLAYKGDDKLYVPTDQVGTVRKYTGGEAPSLHRLGGADFQKTRARVKSAVTEIAQELVVLYRRRLATSGHAFAADTPWQHEVEDAFPYVETPDQLQAILDTKADMERANPMDRLVCGDVGFGKTEVAVRATFKAVQDGTQVAILVPTTLLASQHGQTFRDRFANYPVRVEVLSRFLSAKEQRAVLRDVATGAVDVVIGTHRLLSEDVKFKNLGLLVVDEEQRFGVTHKERIKAMKADVDVLTLSATPIPRTLEMSLTGIRDMSLVNTPPEERQPILTYVDAYDDRAVAEAIRRELLREGQVFFVHNRVQDIEHVVDQLRNLVPEARIAVAHGQMDEGALERVVVDFWEKQYDVLVCTTIVESGIDMPSVNTLIVDRADRLGLAQLYQLRGRVGRRGQRAYAYLFYPPDQKLTEEAYERLKTIGDFTDLGSGFKIAMRDLEIRGAGNLLGETQSGHIAAVGFDLYCEMVTEAVGELMGNVATRPVEVTIDVPVTANLPRDYVSRDDVRMEAYRRLAAVTTPADVDDIEAEWADRYGPLPPEAAALLDIARLRVECLRVGVTMVTVMKNSARLRAQPLTASQQVRLKRLAPSAVAKPDGDLVVPLAVAPADAASAVRNVLMEFYPDAT
ncbi:MAG: transcription-repair coupling factor [Acidimicrobiia bacterium]